jgi:hypothetical protein
VERGQVGVPSPESLQRLQELGQIANFSLRQEQAREGVIVKDHVPQCYKPPFMVEAA